MALSSSVEKVLRLVEEKTGLPVHVEPDSSLPANLLAKVTAGRGAIPFHDGVEYPRRTLRKSVQMAKGYENGSIRNDS